MCPPSRNILPPNPIIGYNAPNRAASSIYAENIGLAVSNMEIDAAYPPPRESEIMAGAIEKLQRFLISNRLLTLEEKLEEMNAPADEGNAIAYDKSVDDIEREEDDLAQLYGPFAIGLKRATGLRGTNQELALSDADPLESAAADALVRYLVRTNIASVRSEEVKGSEPTAEVASDGTLLTEPAPNYTYYFTINCAALELVAKEAGTSLDDVLHDANDLRRMWSDE